MTLRKLWPLFLLLLALVLLYLLGPRVETDERLWQLTLSEDLDDYLARAEARFHNITPGAEKTIIWAGDVGQQTEYAVVFLHGFSATRQELAPLPERVAARLGANLYLARLAGHGQTGTEMAQASVNYWLNDAQEAWALGRRLGKKVILIGNSTGATLATWLAAQPWATDIAALVLISPNFGPAAPGAALLTWPWGEQLATALQGPERVWEPANEVQARYWTTHHPTRALLPMMALVKLLEKAPLERIQQPILTIYSPADTVINPGKIAPTLTRIGSMVQEVVTVPAGGQGSNHILAGDICWPENTEPLAGKILTFVTSVVDAPTR
jgi:esterase/lipase